jgi:hypothetical protein
MSGGGMRHVATVGDTGARQGREVASSPDIAEPVAVEYSSAYSENQLGG